MVQRSDTDLLLASAAGDKDAYAVFFRRHVRSVTKYAVRRCGSAEQVGDLVAETFLIGLEAANRYVPVYETALPWLFGIERRVLAGQRRRWYLQKREMSVHPVVVGDESEAIVAAIDAARRRPELESALAQLSDSEREVFLLVAYDGLSPIEAAAVLGLSPNAARLRLSRARRRMRSHLEPVSQPTEVLHAW